MKLSGHSQNAASYQALSLIERIGTELGYFKMIDPPLAVRVNNQIIPVLDTVANIGLPLIVRHYGVWDADWDAFDPASFVQDCKHQDWWNYAWAIESPNEPHPGDALKLSSLVLMLANEGKECIVGNWGTGWDGFHVDGATYYGCHEYGWPNLLDQAPYQALRYRSWFPKVLEHNPDAKLFITEMGVTQAVVGGPDIGWRSDGRTARAYWDNSLLPYSLELEKDPYVLKAFIYQFGGNPDWETFECTGTEIEDLLVDNVIATPFSTEVMMGKSDELLTHPRFNDWWKEGGYKHFSRHLGAIGQVDLTPAEKRDVVLDGITSIAAESAILLDSLPL